MTTYSEWRTWRNDYYGRICHQGRNVQRMTAHAPATAARKGDWVAEVESATSYYDRVVVPASARLAREFDPALAEKTIANAPAL